MPARHGAATARRMRLTRILQPTPSMAKRKKPTAAEIEAEAAAIYPDTNAGPPTPEQIAEEAHAIYLNRGAADGHALDDWLEAERRLRNKRHGGAADEITG
jgi:hypothetical protein